MSAEYSHCSECWRDNGLNQYNYPCVRTLSEILIKPETWITCSLQSVSMGTWRGRSQMVHHYYQSTEQPASVYISFDTTQADHAEDPWCIRMVFWCQWTKIEWNYYTLIYNSSKYFPTITRLLSVTRAIQSDGVKMFYVASKKKDKKMYSLRDIDCNCMNKQIFINALSKNRYLRSDVEND